MTTFKAGCPKLGLTTLQYDIVFYPSLFFLSVFVVGGPELTLASHPKSGQIVLLEMSHRKSINHSLTNLTNKNQSIVIFAHTKYHKIKNYKKLVINVID